MARMRGPAGRLAEEVARGLLGPWWRRRPRSAAEIVSRRPRRILVVRAHDQIGDAVCATGTLASIRRLFPAARLHLVCAPLHEPVFRHHPDLDGLLVFDRARVNRSLRAMRAFRRALRARRPDGAFVLNTVSFSTTSALIAAGSGARWIVGGSARAGGWEFTRWLYSLELPPEAAAGDPAWRQEALALRRVGFEIPDPLSGPVFVPGEAETVRADSFLAALGPGPAVGLHPGAGKPGNRWPADRFAAVADALHERGARPWVLEGPADQEATAALLRASRHRHPVLRGADLCVAGAALRESSVVLVNDSGPMHVAAAAGATGVALFGPTPASVWAPPGRLEIVEAADGRMDSIATGEVLQLLLERIGRER